jgi:hypothetical protein
MNQLIENVRRPEDLDVLLDQFGDREWGGHTRSSAYHDDSPLPLDHLKVILKPTKRNN